MDRTRAEENLELIRTLMERAIRYEHLSARTGIQVGLVAIVGTGLCLWLGPSRPLAFGAVWAGVFVLALALVLIEHAREVRASGIPVWSRPATQLVRALMPALVVALVLTCHFFADGRHLELPGIWMLCYGCGVLATAAWAPPAVEPVGVLFLVAGSITFWLGPAWSVWMMGLSFGGGHLALGFFLRVGTKPTLRIVSPEVN